MISLQQIIAQVLVKLVTVTWFGLHRKYDEQTVYLLFPSLCQDVLPDFYTYLYFVPCGYTLCTYVPTTKFCDLAAKFISRLSFILGLLVRREFIRIGLTNECCQAKLCMLPFERRHLRAPRCHRCIKHPVLWFVY